MKLASYIISALILASFFFGFTNIKPAFASTVMLSGSVQTASGSAVMGATVSLNDSNNDSTTTDSNGNYSFSIPSGTYNVQVSPRSDSGFSSALAYSQNISTNTTLNFILTPTGTVTLSGKVLDPLGNPVANQTVYLSGGSSGATTTTDSNGNYSLQVESGTYTLDVNGSGNVGLNVPQNYDIASRNYSLTQDTTLNITIPADEITVQVQDSSGNPVSNVPVTTSGNPLYEYGLSLGGNINNAYGFSTYEQSTENSITNSSGTATLWLLPTTVSQGSSPYTLIATPPSGSNYTQFTLNNISVTGNQTEIIALEYSHTTPVTTATLSPSPFSDGTYDDPTSVTLSATAASGYTVANTYYNIDDGSQLTYTTPFTVTGAGSHTITYWSVDNSGAIEATNTKTFTITEAYSISGTVYVDTNQNGVQDNGETGYANATVTVSQNNQTVASTTTDSTGNYTFPNLEAGTYTEALTLPNGYTATTTNPANIALSANTTENFGIVQPLSLATAINAGGDNEENFVADTDYNSGSTFTTSATIDTSGVTNPAAQAVYQSVRYGNFTYTIPNLTANGTYTLQLHFSEPYWGTSQAGGGGVGSRIFNVSVNGTQALSNFDVYQAAGGANKAVMEQIPATADSSGNITVTFTSVVDNAMVSGIEVSQ